MTLSEFLQARIADDEAVLAALHEVKLNRLARAFATTFEADLEAKRRIIHAYLEAEAMHGYGFAAGLAVAVKILAAVYADHPDYDPAWRP